MGASPDSLDNEGRTPISWAAGCQRGQSALRLLLQKSRQVTAFDHKDNTGRAPLSWAAGSGNLHSVQLLLLKGADVCSVDHTGRIPLSWAIQRGSRELVTRLMVNETNIPYKDTTGRTLLSYAAEGGDADTFDTILSQQPDAIDVPDNSGRTPLCWISGGDPGTPSLRVIDKGAVPTQQDLVFRFQRGPPKGKLSTVIQR
ncbi:ankyrin repeat-containing domain protein [Aspergillus insuetus]